MKNRHATTMAAALTAIGFAAFAQQPPAPVPPGAPGSGTASAPAIATIGPLRLGRAEVEARIGSALEQYRARLGTPVPDELEPIVRRQVLESFIRRDLLLLEAQRRGIAVGAAEAEAELRRDPFFQQGGVPDESKFLAIKNGQPQAFQAAIAMIRQQLAARRLNQQLETELGEPAAALRARAERALTRASLDVLPLRSSEFPGTYPEPRELDVLNYYRAHADDYRGPERATLSVAFVDSPALPDSLAGDAAARRAWTEQMRQRADSVLARVRAGATLDAAAESFGALRTNVVVTRDNFPGFWEGDDRLKAAVFRQSAGAVLPEPVPARSGWLLARVDEVRPAQVAPLAEVAREIRGRLRDAARSRGDERDLRGLYDSVRDSLRATGYHLRYAVVDTARIDPGEPPRGELDRFYRAHLADYARFDPATAAVSARPLSEVTGDVRERWRLERRQALAREQVARLEAAWRRGARDRTAEAAAGTVREVGPVTLGALADTGRAGPTLTDSLARRAGAIGVGVGPVRGGGTLVFQVVDAVPGVVPSFDQARPVLSRRLEARRAREDEANARQLFDRDPRSFVGGDVVVFTRLFVPQPELVDVPMTRAEVERYHREHIDRYSAPEEIRVRHILISPTGPGGAADSVARAKAEALLRRVRSGEDFAGLARQYSDDPATREQGGDLGMFGRGAMLEGFERVAFALEPDQVSDLVKTEVGYHIIKCLERHPAVAQPLEWLYANVGADLALEKAKRIGKQRADSLYAAARTPAALRAAADRLHYPYSSIEHVIGDRRGIPELIPFLERIETVKPGQIYPGAYEMPGLGWGLSWVDSVMPARAPRWEDAKPRAIATWRGSAGQRTLEAKRAELDSLETAGWSFDSLATLWGGLQHEPAVTEGRGIAGLGGAAIVDSLVFGAPGGARLERNGVSGWLAFPSAAVRMRLVQRVGPDATQLASRVENDRRARLERRLYAYFETLKRRYPVRILDPKLRDVVLPEPPPE